MSRRKDLEDEFRRIASTEVIGRTIEWHDQLPSTNERAMVLAKEGCPEGTIVTADAQTAGKGTQGRSWYSPASGGLWVSIVLYPTQSMARVPQVTTMAAQAIEDYLSKELYIKATIKPPNDILLKGAKVCGILAQAQTTAGSSKVDFVVLGFGLNVRLQFPEELATTATSLADHVSRPLPPRTSMLASLARFLEERYLI